MLRDSWKKKEQKPFHCKGKSIHIAFYFCQLVTLSTEYEAISSSKIIFYFWNLASLLLRPKKVKWSIFLSHIEKTIYYCMWKYFMFWKLAPREAIYSYIYIIDQLFQLISSDLLPTPTQWQCSSWLCIYLSLCSHLGLTFGCSAHSRHGFIHELPEVTKNFLGPVDDDSTPLRFHGSFIGYKVLMLPYHSIKITNIYFLI